MLKSDQQIFIGIDAGTSYMKAVAFDERGNQLGKASQRNIYDISNDGAATQSLNDTWKMCASTLIELGQKIEGLASRVAAIAVTAQGDGTWLVDKDNAPAADAWLWLDARAAPTVRAIQQSAFDVARFNATGTGINTCQMGAQLAHMKNHAPELLEKADVALHCKDWLYLCLTDVRATDPSEGCLTFGDFRTRQYVDEVVDGLGLGQHQHLLPPILDGTQEAMPLSAEAARQIGLAQGTPVVLGAIDMVCTALGAGVLNDRGMGCTVLGSTGVHLLAVKAEDAVLNAERTGYIMTLPAKNMVTQMQSNMACTLNIDFMIDLAMDLTSDLGAKTSKDDVMARIEDWLKTDAPSGLIYHPYISDAGERGPFVNDYARASFVGLNSTHRFKDMFLSLVEGLALAAKDCFSTMGEVPNNIILTGGASRSTQLRRIFSAITGASIVRSLRDEAGASGAAMMAAVQQGVYPDMQTCVDDWVMPQLAEQEKPDAVLVEAYAPVFQIYQDMRHALAPFWHRMDSLKK